MREYRILDYFFFNNEDIYHCIFIIARHMLAVLYIYIILHFLVCT